MNQVIDKKMNPVIYNEDYSWYGDERIGRTRNNRNNRHNKTVQTESNDETSHMLATMSTIIGLIICIIKYTLTAMRTP